MRRASKVSLVLITGTAVALGLSTCRQDPAECEEARAAGRPDAEELCRRATSSGRSGYSSSSGRSWFSHGASARGGFGGSARSVGS